MPLNQATNSQKITTFFKAVTPKVHKLNNSIEFQRLDIAIERIETERERNLQIRQQQSVEDVNRRQAAPAQRMRNDSRTVEEVIRDNIEDLVNDVDNHDEVDDARRRSKRKNESKKMRDVIDVAQNHIILVPEEVEDDGELNINDLIAPDDDLETELTNAVQGIAFDDDDEEEEDDDDEIDNEIDI